MTSTFDKLPRYDRTRSYDWNFENAPQETPQIEIPNISGDWEFCGLPVNSPLGIAAGPLLNGDWLSYYATLGFDVLTYKTVRTRYRECYPLPNLVPVETEMMNGEETHVTLSDEWLGSWAVSFGMPSREPDFWMEDISKTKEKLSPEQVLNVSVVGTMQPSWTLDDLADDYAQCAAMAQQAGADTVEANFSCPNVCSADGQLFQNPQDAALVAERIRSKLGKEMPLLIKVGYIKDDVLLEDLLSVLSRSVDALVMTNSLPSKVFDKKHAESFHGEQRGICGRATRNASLNQIARCSTIIEKHSLPLTLIGVGGIESVADVKGYLAVGAQNVQLATAPMVDPLVGAKIRSDWSE